MLASQKQLKSFSGQVFELRRRAGPLAPKTPQLEPGSLSSYKHNRDLEPARYSGPVWLTGLAHLYREAL